MARRRRTRGKQSPVGLIVALVVIGLLLLVPDSLTRFGQGFARIYATLLLSSMPDAHIGCGLGLQTEELQVGDVLGVTALDVGERRWEVLEAGEGVLQPLRQRLTYKAVAPGAATFRAVLRVPGDATMPTAREALCEARISVVAARYE